MKSAVLLKFFISVSFLLVVNGFDLPFEELFPLSIIHYNDFHARFEETSIATPTCRYNNNSCLGGFPRLYHEIQVLLKQKPDAILLNAGDSFQGTYWYTLLKWNVTQEFMNMLPHDAHAIGNHDFDDGPAGLVPYLKSLKAPVLVANMDVRDEPALKGLFQPSTVVERHGRKIGIIGLITPETKNVASPGKVVFTDPGEAMRREALALTEQGVDIIILLSHCGLDVEKKLARDHGKYIDIIVGGHSHSLLWNGEVPSGETAEGSYPVIVETTEDKRHKVLIVQASAFTKYIGNLTVYFNYRGDFVDYDGDAIFLNRSIAEDEEIKKKLEPYAKMVHDAENVLVGESLTTLPYEDCMYRECAVGDLLVDTMVQQAKETIDPDTNYLAFIQRGNLKSSILEGDITEGTLFEILPFRNQVVLFQLQGRYVIEALEHSVSDAWTYDPFTGPWILQVAGLRVTYNVSQPQGSRITSLSLGDYNDPTTIKPFEQNAYYNVVAPKFLADGGDGFVMFKNYKRNNRIIGRDDEILKSYIEKHSPLNITTYDRIIINS